MGEKKKSKRGDRSGGGSSSGNHGATVEWHALAGMLSSEAWGEAAVARRRVPAGPPLPLVSGAAAGLGRARERY